MFCVSGGEEDTKFEGSSAETLLRARNFRKGHQNDRQIEIKRKS